MTLIRIFLAALITFPVALKAQPNASEPQTREWTEKNPPNGLTITNADKYVDYARGGKIAFRGQTAPDTADSYTARKHSFIQMTERGHLHKLGREQLLEAEKKQP